MDNRFSKIKNYLQEKVDLINQTIAQSIPHENVPPILKEAMEYSLTAGGKRIRPILTLATYEAFGKDMKEILSIAVNLEFLHTYSLIHDDLPAMDNDDYRRGKPTNHKIYGEALAILAGDALLTHAFGNMAKSLGQLPNTTLTKGMQIVEEFAAYTGASGMVGGQVIDLKAEQNEATLDDLIYIHTHKTGDLILFSIRLGALLADANEKQLAGLSDFGRKIGLAFQIQDDLLDIIGDSNKMGKRAGSDEINHKVTYPFFKGINTSKEQVLKLTEEAKQSIAKIGIKTEFLYQLADYLIFREI